mmetsp:Transcript_12733/g.27499  ORF Transcript_12733/g.27499 Transcript_12733/m.27499 type:complete len:255 (-) Transcript_12733:156-920(-)
MTPSGITQRIPSLNPVSDGFPPLSLSPLTRLGAVRRLISLKFFRNFHSTVRPGVPVRIRERLSILEAVLHRGLATERPRAVVSSVQLVLDSVHGIGCRIITSMSLVMALGHGDLVRAFPGMLVPSHVENWVQQVHRVLSGRRAHDEAPERPPSQQGKHKRILPQGRQLPQNPVHQTGVARLPSCRPRRLRSYRGRCSFLADVPPLQRSQRHVACRPDDGPGAQSAESVDPQSAPYVGDGSNIVLRERVRRGEGS